MIVRQELQPFEPTPANPWDRRKVAHLYRRAAFGDKKAGWGDARPTKGRMVAKRPYNRKRALGILASGKYGQRPASSLQ